jgi:single-strand DNA-binding protein
MSGVNKVILVGNLGSDPDVRYTTGNQPVAHFSLATSESWTNKNGERVDRTEWHRVTVWGKQAEKVGEFLSKGRQVYVEGKLRTRSWEGKDGQKRYTTEVIADSVVFLGGGRGEGGGRGPARQAEAAGGKPPAEEGPMDIGGAEPPPDEEDIPF